MKSFKWFTLSAITHIIKKFDVQKGIEFRFYVLFKRKMNVQNPTTLSEVVLGRAFSEENRKLSLYADKYRVRDYVKETIGESYLIPLLAVYDKPSDVDFSQIPDQAYVKMNHGCSFNICYDRTKKKSTLRKLKKWSKRDFSKAGNEQQYYAIPRKILVQENIAPQGTVLTEYSFHILNGDIDLVQIRDNRHHRFEVSRTYEKLPYQLISSVTPITEKPAEFDQLVTLAETLAKPFTYVRVDFFVAKGNIYFGELTFSPSAGFFRFTPDSYNKIFADKIKDLPLFR